MNDKEVEILLKLKNEMSGALKNADRDLDRFGQTADTASQKTDKVGSKAKSSFNKAATAVAALGAAWVTSNVIGYAQRAIDAYASFEQRLVDVSTLIDGDASQAMENLSNGIDNLTEKVPKSADELGASAYDIVSAGFQDSADSLKILEESSRLAVAGLGDTKEATDIMTSALNAFQLNASDSDRVANSLFETVKNGKTTVSELSRSFGSTAPTFAAANFQLEDFLSATAALTTTGLSASEAQTALRQTVSSMIKPTKDMQDLFDTLGKDSMSQMVDEGMNLGEIFDALSDAAGGSEEKLADAFGSVEAFNAVASISGNQNKAYKDTLEDLTDESDSVKDAFDKQTDSAKNQAQIQENRVNKSMREFGEAMSPAKESLTDLKVGMIEIATDVLPDLIVGMQVFGEGIGKHIFTPIADGLGLLEKANEKLSMDEFLEFTNFAESLDIDPEALPPEVAVRLADIASRAGDSEQKLGAMKEELRAFSQLEAWGVSKSQMQDIRQAAIDMNFDMDNLSANSRERLKEIAESGKEPEQKFKDLRAEIGEIIIETNKSKAAMDNYVDTVLERIPQSVDELSELARVSSANAFNQTFGSIFGGAEMPYRSTGGAVQEGRPYIVGETGPELFIAPSNGRIESQRTINNNTNNASVNININGGDRSMVMQAVQEGLRKAGLTANAQLNTLNGLNNTRF